MTIPLSASLALLTSMGLLSLFLFFCLDLVLVLILTRSFPLSSYVVFILTCLFSSRGLSSLTATSSFIFSVRCESFLNSSSSFLFFYLSFLSLFFSCFSSMSYCLKSPPCAFFFLAASCLSSYSYCLIDIALSSLSSCCYLIWFFKR